MVKVPRDRAALYVWRWLPYHGTGNMKPALAGAVEAGLKPIVTRISEARAIDEERILINPRFHRLGRDRPDALLVLLHRQPRPARPRALTDAEDEYLFGIWRAKPKRHAPIR